MSVSPSPYLEYRRLVRTFAEYQQHRQRQQQEQADAISSVVYLPLRYVIAHRLKVTSSMPPEDPNQPLSSTTSSSSDSTNPVDTSILAAAFQKAEQKTQAPSQREATQQSSDAALARIEGRTNPRTLNPSTWIQKFITSHGNNTFDAKKERRVFQAHTKTQARLVDIEHKQKQATSQSSTSSFNHQEPQRGRTTRFSIYEQDPLYRVPSTEEDGGKNLNPHFTAKPGEHGTHLRTNPVVVDKSNLSKAPIQGNPLPNHYEIHASWEDAQRKKIESMLKTMLAYKDVMGGMHPIRAGLRLPLVQEAVQNGEISTAKIQEMHGLVEEAGNRAKMNGVMSRLDGFAGRAPLASDDSQFKSRATATDWGPLETRAQRFEAMKNAEPAIEATKKQMQERAGLTDKQTKNLFHGGQTDQQYNVMTAASNVLAINGGPGAGKTETLVKRLAYLAQQGHKVDQYVLLSPTHSSRDQLYRRVRSNESLMVSSTGQRADFSDEHLKKLHATTRNPTGTHTEFSLAMSYLHKKSIPQTETDDEGHTYQTHISPFERMGYARKGYTPLGDGAKSRSSQDDAKSLSDLMDRKPYLDEVQNNYIDELKNQYGVQQFATKSLVDHINTIKGSAGTGPLYKDSLVAGEADYENNDGKITTADGFFYLYESSLKMAAKPNSANGERFGTPTQKNPHYDLIDSLILAKKTAQTLRENNIEGRPTLPGIGIDEYQDMLPVAIAMIAEMTTPQSQVMFAGDMGQKNIDNDTDLTKHVKDVFTNHSEEHKNGSQFALHELTGSKRLSPTHAALINAASSDPLLINQPRSPFMVSVRTDPNEWGEIPQFHSTNTFQQSDQHIIKKMMKDVGISWKQIGYNLREQTKDPDYPIFASAQGKPSQSTAIFMMHDRRKTFEENFLKVAEDRLGGKEIAQNAFDQMYTNESLPKNGPAPEKFHGLLTSQVRSNEWKNTYVDMTRGGAWNTKGYLRQLFVMFSRSLENMHIYGANEQVNKNSRNKWDNIPEERDGQEFPAGALGLKQRFAENLIIQQGVPREALDAVDQGLLNPGVFASNDEHVAAPENPKAMQQLVDFLKTALLGNMVQPSVEQLKEIMPNAEMEYNEEGGLVRPGNTAKITSGGVSGKYAIDPDEGKMEGIQEFYRQIAQGGPEVLKAYGFTSIPDPGELISSKSSFMRKLSQEQGREMKYVDPHPEKYQTEKARMDEINEALKNPNMPLPEKKKITKEFADLRKVTGVDAHIQRGPIRRANVRLDSHDIGYAPTELASDVNDHFGSLGQAAQPENSADSKYWRDPITGKAHSFSGRYQQQGISVDIAAAIRRLQALGKILKKQPNKKLAQEATILQKTIKQHASLDSSSKGGRKKKNVSPLEASPMERAQQAAANILRNETFRQHPEGEKLLRSQFSRPAIVDMVDKFLKNQKDVVNPLADTTKAKKDTQNNIDILKKKFEYPSNPNFEQATLQKRIKEAGKNLQPIAQKYSEQTKKQKEAWGLAEELRKADPEKHKEIQEKIDKLQPEFSDIDKTKELQEKAKSSLQGLKNKLGEISGTHSLPAVNTNIEKLKRSNASEETLKPWMALQTAYSKLGGLQSEAHLEGSIYDMVANPAHPNYNKKLAEHIWPHAIRQATSAHGLDQPTMETINSVVTSIANDKSLDPKHDPHQMATWNKAFKNTKSPWEIQLEELQKTDLSEKNVPNVEQPRNLDQIYDQTKSNLSGLVENVTSKVGLAANTEYARGLEHTYEQAKRDPVGDKIRETGRFPEEAMPDRDNLIKWNQYLQRNYAPTRDEEENSYEDGSKKEDWMTLQAKQQAPDPAYMATLKRDDPHQHAFVTQLLQGRSIDDSLVDVKKDVHHPAIVAQFAGAKGQEYGLSLAQSNIAPVLKELQNHVQRFQNPGDERQGPGGIADKGKGNWDAINHQLIPSGDSVSLQGYQQRLSDLMNDKKKAYSPQYIQELQETQQLIAEKMKDKENVPVAENTDFKGYSPATIEKYQQIIDERMNNKKNTPGFNQMLEGYQQFIAEKMHFKGYSPETIQKIQNEHDQVAALRKMLNDKDVQEAQAHYMNIAIHATMGDHPTLRGNVTQEQRKQAKGKQPLDIIFGHQRDRLSSPDQYTLEGATEYYQALNDATVAMQSSGELKRGHLDRVLKALGHDPQDGRFAGLRILSDRHGFRNADDTISLAKLAHEYAGEDNTEEVRKTMGEFTSHPLHINESVRFRGKPVGPFQQGSISKGMKGNLVAFPYINTKTNDMARIKSGEISFGDLPSDVFGKTNDKITLNNDLGLISKEQKEYLGEKYSPKDKKFFNTDKHTPVGSPYLFKTEDGRYIPVLSHQVVPTKYTDRINNGGGELLLTPPSPHVPVTPFTRISRTALNHLKSLFRIEKPARITQKLDQSQQSKALVPYGRQPEAQQSVSQKQPKRQPKPQSVHPTITLPQYIQSIRPIQQIARQRPPMLALPAPLLQGIKQIRSLVPYTRNLPIAQKQQQAAHETIVIPRLPIHHAQSSRPITQQIAGQQQSQQLALPAPSRQEVPQSRALIPFVQHLPAIQRQPTPPKANVRAKSRVTFDSPQLPTIQEPVLQDTVEQAPANEKGKFRKGHHRYTRQQAEARKQVQQARVQARQQQQQPVPIPPPTPTHTSPTPQEQPSAQTTKQARVNYKDKVHQRQQQGEARKQVQQDREMQRERIRQRHQQSRAQEQHLPPQQVEAGRPPEQPVENTVSVTQQNMARQQQPNQNQQAEPEKVQLSANDPYGDMYDEDEPQNIPDIMYDLGKTVREGHTHPNKKKDFPPPSAEQKAVIESGQQHKIITGGPGGGKTHTLVRAAMQRVANEELLPKDMLSLSPMKSGVNVLNNEFEKYRDLLPENNDDYTIPRATTFHSLAAQILFAGSYNNKETQERHYPVMESLGWHNFTGTVLSEPNDEDLEDLHPDAKLQAYEESQSHFLNKEIKAYRDMGHQLVSPKYFDAVKAVSDIGEYKKKRGNGLGTYKKAYDQGEEDLQKGQLTHDSALVLYQQGLKNKGMIDYDEMIHLGGDALEGMRNHKDLPIHLQDKKQINMDEVQDITHSSHRLVSNYKDILDKGGVNSHIYAGLDQMQSLMQSMGGINLNKIMPTMRKWLGVSPFSLRNNFRSDPKTVALNNAILKHPMLKGQAKSDPQFPTSRPQGLDPQFILSKSHPTLHKQMFENMLTTVGITPQQIGANVRAGNKPMEGIDWTKKTRAGDTITPSESPAIMSTMRQQALFRHEAQSVLMQQGGLTKEQADETYKQITTKKIIDTADKDKKEAAMKLFPVIRIAAARSRMFMAPHIDVTRVGHWLGKGVESTRSYLRNLYTSVSRVKKGGLNSIYATDNPLKNSDHDFYLRHPDTFTHAFPGAGAARGEQVTLNGRTLSQKGEGNLNEFQQYAHQTVPNMFGGSYGFLQTQQNELHKWVGEHRIDPPARQQTPSLSRQAMPQSNRSMPAAPPPNLAQSTPSPDVIPAEYLEFAKSHAEDYRAHLRTLQSIHPTQKLPPTNRQTPPRPQQPMLVEPDYIKAQQDQLQQNHASPQTVVSQKPPTRQNTPPPPPRRQDKPEGMESLEGLLRSESLNDPQDQIHQNQAPSQPAPIASPPKQSEHGSVSHHIPSASTITQAQADELAKQFENIHDAGRKERLTKKPGTPGFGVPNVVDSNNEEYQHLIDQWKKTKDDKYAIAALHHEEGIREEEKGQGVIMNSILYRRSLLEPVREKLSGLHPYLAKSFFYPYAPTSSNGIDQHLTFPIMDPQEQEELHPGPNALPKIPSAKPARKPFRLPWTRPERHLAIGGILQTPEDFTGPNGDKIGTGEGGKPEAIVPLADLLKNIQSNASSSDLKQQYQAHKDVVALADQKPTDTHTQQVIQDVLKQLAPMTKALGQQGHDIADAHKNILDPFQGAQNSKSPLIIKAGAQINITGAQQVSVIDAKKNGTTPTSLPSVAKSASNYSGINIYSQMPHNGQSPAKLTPSSSSGTGNAAPQGKPKIALKKSPALVVEESDSADKKDKPLTTFQRWHNNMTEAGHSFARVGGELQFIGQASTDLTNQALTQGSNYRLATVPLGKEASGSNGTSGFFDFTKQDKGISAYQSKTLPMYSDTQVAQMIQALTGSTNTKFSAKQTLPPLTDIAGISALTGIDSQQLMGQMTGITGMAGGGSSAATLQGVSKLTGMLTNLYGSNLTSGNVGSTLDALGSVLPSLQGLNNSGNQDQTGQAMSFFKLANDAGMTSNNLPAVADTVNNLSQMGSNPNLQQQYQLSQLFPNSPMTADTQLVNYQADQNNNAQQIAQLGLQQNINGKGLSLPNLQIQISQAQISMDKAQLDMSGFQQQYGQAQLGAAQFQQQYNQAQYSASQFQQQYNQAQYGAAQFQQQYNQASFNQSQDQQNQLYGPIGADSSKKSYYSLQQSQLAAGYDSTNPEAGLSYAPSKPFGLKNEEFYSGMQHQQNQLVTQRSPLLSDMTFQDNLKNIKDQEDFYKREIDLQNQDRSFNKIWQQKQLDVQNTMLGWQKKQLDVQNTMLGWQKQQLDVQNTMLGWQKQQLDKQAGILDIQQQQFGLEQEKAVYDQKQYALQNDYLKTQSADLAAISLSMQQQLLGQGPVNGKDVTPAQIIQQLANQHLSDSALTDKIRGMGIPLGDISTMKTLTQQLEKGSKNGGLTMDDITKQLNSANDKKLNDDLKNVINAGATANSDQLAAIANAFLAFGGTTDNWNNLIANTKNIDNDIITLASKMSGTAPWMQNMGTIANILGPLLLGIASLLNIMGMVPAFIGMFTGGGAAAATTAGGAATVAGVGGATAAGVGGATAAGVGGVAAAVAAPIAVTLASLFGGWSLYNKDDTAKNHGKMPLLSWSTLLNTLDPISVLGTDAHKYTDAWNDPKFAKQIGANGPIDWLKNLFGQKPSSPSSGSTTGTTPGWIQQAFGPKPTPAPKPDPLHDPFGKPAITNPTGHGGGPNALIAHFPGGTETNIAQPMKPDPSIAQNVGVFFSKTLPAWLITWIAKPVGIFFSQMLGTFFMKTFPAFFIKWVADPISLFFSKILPTFFRKTLPDLLKAWIGDPVSLFFSKILPDFITKTIPDFLVTWVGQPFLNLMNWAGDQFKKYIWNPASNLFNGAVKGFQKNVWDPASNFFTNAGKGIKKSWLDPAFTLFTKGIPDFFTKTLPQKLTDTLKGVFIDKSGNNIFTTIFKTILGGGGSPKGGGTGSTPIGHPGFVTPHVNQEFGVMNASRGIHEGVDFAAAQGTPIGEFIGGKVSHTGHYDWGGEVDVELPNGMTERYIHLSAIGVKTGDKLRRGNFVGLSGGGTVESGLGWYSDGPHLHYQTDFGSYNNAISPWRTLAAFGDTNIMSDFGVGMGRIQNYFGGPGRHGSGSSSGASSMGQSERRVHLYEGGVAMKRMKAEIAEHEPEAVIPISKLTSVLQSTYQQTSSMQTQAQTTTTQKNSVVATLAKIADTLEVHVHTSAQTLDASAQDSLMAQLLDIFNTALKDYNGKMI